MKKKNTKVERVAKKFYDNVKKGKFYGIKCKDCKKWSFPAITACRECGSRNITWRQISGDGEVYFYSTSILPPKKFAKYSPYAYGEVILKEGPSFFTMIQGLSAKSPEAIKKGNEKLPLKAKAIKMKKAGMDIVGFKIVKKGGK